MLGALRADRIMTKSAALGALALSGQSWPSAVAEVVATASKFSMVGLTVAVEVSAVVTQAYLILTAVTVLTLKVAEAVLALTGMGATLRATLGELVAQV